jgi:putative peptidoglycan lipid II flippase
MASLLSFAVQIGIARQFGVSERVDAYYFSSSVPAFISGVVCAAISYSCIPLLARDEAETIIRGNLLQKLVFASAISAGVMSLLGLLALYLQPLILPASSAVRNVSELHSMIALSWCLGGIQLCIAVFVAHANAKQRPVTAVFFTMFPILLSLLTIFARGQGLSRIILALIIGNLAVVVAAAWMFRSQLLPFKLHLNFPIGRGVGLAIGSALIATTSFTSFGVIDAFWAPRAGEGILATMGFAQRLMIGIGSILVAGPAALVIPRISRARSLGNLPEVRRLVIRMFISAGAGAGGAAVLLALMADRVVDLAFAHGAFTQENAASVSRVIDFMLPGLCGMMISVLAVRTLYSFPRTALLSSAMGIGWVVSYFSLCGLLGRRGTVGFATSYSITWCAFAIVSMWYLYWRIRPQSERMTRTVGPGL